MRFQGHTKADGYAGLDIVDDELMWLMGENISSHVK